MTQRIWTAVKTLPFFCALGLAGHQAQAQEASTPPASARGPLEEVVVTANRREEKINDIGMAIQAFSGDALDQFAVANVGDLQNIVPSFSVTQGYQGVPVYTLRGVGFNAINFSATSTVGTYVDEAAYAYPIMNTGPIFDVERVEVLKGPQGTLYGRNTTGGLIDVITNKPTKTFQSMVSADVGNFETYNAEGFVSGPLFGDRVQGRLAVRAETSGRGFQESVTSGERLGEKEKYGVRASLAVQPTDSTNIDFSANYFLNKSDTLAGQAVAFVPTADPAILLPNPMTGVLERQTFSFTNAPSLCDTGVSATCQTFALRQPDDARNADFTPRSVREQTVGTGTGFKGRLQEDNPFVGLKLRVAQDITDGIRLVSLTNYNYFERDGLTDAGGATAQIFVNEVTGKINSFAEDLHLEGETEGGINWLAGVYYANDRIIDTTRSLVFENTPVNTVRGLAETVRMADPIAVRTDANGVQFSALGFPINSFNNPPGRAPFSQTEVAQAFREFQDGGTIQTETYSFFANGDAPLTDSLKLNVGARFTNEVQDFAGCSRDFNGNIIPTVTLANRFLNATAPGPFQGQLATAPNVGECVTFDARTNTFGIVRSRLDENNISWRAGLDWKATEDVLLYTTVSRGFKAGTTPLNASNSAEQNAPVTQEKLTAFEIGTKSSLFDRRIQANVAGFFYDYKDKQINTFFQDPIFTVLARLDNVNESELYGIDADVTFRATDSLSFNLNALGVHSEVTKYVGTDQFARTIDFSGSEIPATPKWLVAGTVFYQTELASWNVSGALNARYQKRSSTVLQGGPAVVGYDETIFDIPGFAVVNGSVGFTNPDGTLSFSLFGRNLLDKYYFQSIITNASTVVRYAGEPRTFGLTATKKF